MCYNSYTRTGIEIPCNTFWYCMGCNSTFYSLTCFHFSIILPFYPFDILHFFIQRLRLEINFLTSNLSPPNKLQDHAIPFCMRSQSPEQIGFIGISLTLLNVVTIKKFFLFFMNTMKWF
jgi:hypothetical protein